ncbi:MAG: DUF4352 domain-containing protein [Thermomicrobium sp.]|nr:DUF4352 domain-containing protein [Thermomicrobium sp.]
MRRFLKVLAIGAGGILAICVLVAVLTSLGGDGGTPTPTAAQASRGETPTPSRPVTVAPTAAQAAATTPTAPQAAATATPAPQVTPTLPWGTSKEDVHATLAEWLTAELADGKEIYRLTLERIVDGAVSTNPLQRPKEGNRYLLFRIVVENAGTRAHLITSSNFQLRTSAGFDYDPLFAPVGFAEGEGLSQEIGPGGKTRGIVVFEIPEGEQPLFLKFDPNPLTSAELYFDAPNALELVQSGAVGQAAPAQPEGTPGDQAGKSWGTSKNDRHVPLAPGQSGAIADGKQVYRLTIHAIVDGATSSNMFVQPKEGHKFWLVQVLFENAGTSSVHLVGTEWALRTQDGFDYEPEIMVAGFSEGELLSGEVGPGGKTQGIIVFQIPQDAQPLFLKFDPNPFTSAELYFDAQ